MQYFLGYMLTYLYVGVLALFLCFIFGKKIGSENSRKLVHFFLFFVWYIIDVFLKGSIHMFILPLTIVALNTLEYKFKLIKSFHREGEKESPGTVYFAIVVTIIYIIAYFVPSMYPATGIGVVALTFGDGMAAFIGEKIKSEKLYKNKSLAGTIGCCLATFAGLLIYKYVFCPELNWFGIALISVITAISELSGSGLDNIAVTLSAFFAGYALITLGNDFAFALLYAEILFITVFAFKLINYPGSLLSGFIVGFFYYFGGYRCLAFLVGCYLLNVITHVIRKIKKVHDDVVKKDSTKDFIQIVSNGIAGLAGIVIFAFTKDIRHQIIGIICICACFIDSVSSDIGTMSKKDPFDIFKMKTVKRGVSGGMSWLGTISAFAVSAGLACAITFAFELKYIYILYITLTVFAGTMVDSTLGSLLQVKYKCQVCEKITEKEEHCNQKCVQIEGYKFFNNDVVNLISSFVVFGLSFLTVSGI